MCVKYCNHLLAVDMASVACRGLCIRVVGKMSKDIVMGIRIGTVVAFVPTLFGCFLGFHPCNYVFLFVKNVFCDLFQFFFSGGGGGYQSY